jgi:hypothetical protein
MAEIAFCVPHQLVLPLVYASFRMYVYCDMYDFLKLCVVKWLTMRILLVALCSLYTTVTPIAALRETGAAVKAGCKPQLHSQQ